MSLDERGDRGAEDGAADVEGDQIAGHLERFGKSFRDGSRDENFLIYGSGLLVHKHRLQNRFPVFTQSLLLSASH